MGKGLFHQLQDLGIPTLPLSSSDIDLCKPNSVDFLEGVIREEDALVFISAITPDKGKGTSQLMQNLLMGQHVSNFLAKRLCSHVVYISTDAVYEDNAHLVRETTCCNPSSFHGLMHLVRERMLIHSLQQSGKSLAILRPSLLYGAGDTHNGYGPNRFVQTALKDGKIVLFGKGEEKRDHVYIGDVSRLILLSLKHRSEGVLNIATGITHSFFEVAQAVGSLCGKDVQIECLPRGTAITHRHFDTTAIVRAFPSFQSTSFRIGLSENFKILADKPNG